MKKIILSLVIIVSTISAALCQKYFTKSGQLTFTGKSGMTITATSNQATSVIDATTGDIIFKVLQTSFQFERALMQEHYNEKYMESEKYPDASFKGRITNLKDVDFKKDGSYTVKVTGDLTMHGVTKNISVEGTLTVKDGKIKTQAKFQVAEKDFKIEIPAAVKDKVAESMDVVADFTYSPLGK